MAGVKTLSSTTPVNTGKPDAAVLVVGVAGPVAPAVSG
jgi:hypothetical protein